MVCCVTSAAGSAEAARSTRQNHMLRCTSTAVLGFLVFLLAFPGAYNEVTSFGSSHSFNSSTV